MVRPELPVPRGRGRGGRGGKDVRAMGLAGVAGVAAAVAVAAGFFSARGAPAMPAGGDPCSGTRTGSVFLEAVADGDGAASVDTGLAVSFTTGVTTAAPDSDVDGDEGWAGAAASLGGNGGSPSSAGSTRKAGMACANASPPKSERMARTPSFR